MTDPADSTRAQHAAADVPAADNASADSASADTPAAEGSGIILASWTGTVVFALTSALAVAVHQVDFLALIVALALFAAGTVGFFVAFVGAVNRSRTDEIGIMNLFFLDRSAPRPVRRSLLASLAVEIATAIAAAAIRPNTSVAFGILAPVYGIALAGVWGARHGTFPKRQAKPAKPAKPARPAKRKR